MMSDLVFLAYVQVFLLLMLVVGGAAWAVSKGLDNDPNASFGGAALFYAITIIGWIFLTVITIATLGALAFGIVWAWVSFVQR